MLLNSNKFLLKALFFSFLNICFYLNSTSQSIDSKEAFNLIKTLSSDKYLGRSHSNDGFSSSLNVVDSIIHAHHKSTIKHYDILVDTTLNVINKISLLKNEFDLQFNQDYIPHGSIRSTNVKGSIKWIQNDLSKLQSNQILLIKENDFESLNAAMQFIYSNAKALFSKKIQLILIESPQLAFSPSTFQIAFPIVIIKPDLFEDQDMVLLNCNSVIKKITLVNRVYRPSYVKKSAELSYMAHLDHLGKVGPYIFNGANDNASGVSLAVTSFINQVYNGKSVELIITDGEELGLIGSYHLNRKKKNTISFLINLDMVSSGDGSFGLVGMSRSSKIGQSLSNKFKNTSFEFRVNIPNSDHYWFLKNGIKGFYLYSSNGKQPYHNIDDDAKTLKFSVYAKSSQIINHISEFILN